MTAPRDDTVEGLLEPAYTAAHRALGRLDDEDVPAALRSVRAASKKRSLPAPFRRVLSTHLEEDWLRELAIAELDEGSGPAFEASRAFLFRPDGWEDQIAALGREQADRRQQHDLETVASENRRLEEVNDELSRRLREADDRIHDLELQLGSDERIEALRARLEEAHRALARRESEVGHRDDEIARLRHELAEADERMGVLRSRAARSGESPSGERGGPRGFGRGRPVETARLLDELVETMRPRPGDTVSSVEVPPLALPPGVRPDSHEAIRWIQGLDRRVLLVVDGHNVAHDLGPEPGRPARDRIVSEVARLRRLSDGPVAAIVFFDTGQDPDTHTSFGVTVRYVDDADAAIEAVVAAVEVECIVVSTDKEVRQRSAAHGALALWGTALSDWILRR